MPQADFAYAAANDTAGFPLALSIFADRPHLRDQLREDAQLAGFRIMQAAEISALLGADDRPLGEIVLLDCPAVNGASLAALAQLDLLAARSNTYLVVSTSLASLDDIFGCLDQSNPAILVDPSRAERVVALGGILARISKSKVQDLNDEDRLLLLRLTEQVSQIAERLDKLDPRSSRSAGETHGEDDSVFRFESPRRSFAAEEEPGQRLVRATRPPLPDPRLVRRIIRQRQLRARFFDGDLFADPAWDMLLDLTAARAEHARVSITSLCIASGVPPTTALRWIGQMTEAGLLERVEDEIDKRRAFITLTDKAADAMARFFSELGRTGARLV